MGGRYGKWAFIGWAGVVIVRTRTGQAAVAPEMLVVAVAQEQTAVSTEPQCKLGWPDGHGDGVARETSMERNRARGCKGGEGDGDGLRGAGRGRLTAHRLLLVLKRLNKYRVRFGGESDTSCEQLLAGNPFPQPAFKSTLPTSLQQNTATRDARDGQRRAE